MTIGNNYRPTKPVIPKELCELALRFRTESLDEVYDNITWLIPELTLKRGLTKLTGKRYGIGGEPMYEGIKELESIVKAGRKSGMGVTL